ncbi:MAG: PAS domain S-box protein [Chloroflexi bacterium]|nr:PAS domain S-box protein [Chloroflexota bacterium]
MTKPPAATSDPEDRSSAGLLSSLLLLLFLLITLLYGLPALVYGPSDPFTNPDFMNYLTGVAITLGMYTLSRRIDHRTTALVTSLLFCVVVGVAAYPRGLPHQLDYLRYMIVPVLLASMFLSVPVILFVSVFGLAVMVGVGLLEPNIWVMEILVPFGSLLVIATVLTVLATDHRNRLEVQRRSQLEANERQLRLITDTAQDMIVMTDLRGLVRYISPSAQQWLGQDAADVDDLGVYQRLWETRIDPDDMQPVFVSVWEAMRTQQPTTFEFRMRNLAGDYDWLEANLDFLFDDKTQPQGLVFVIRDISARKEAEAQRLERERLETVLEQEQTLGELKNHFMRMISHEFRNPLASIRMSTDMLLEYGDRMDADGRKRRLDGINEQVAQLTMLLNDFTTVIHMQGEYTAFEPHCVDVLALSDTIVENFKQNRAGTRRFTCAHDGPLTAIFLDERLFQHILTNLLSNAVKYSPDGSEICLSLSVADATLTLAVSDQGDGIPPADQERIFEPFFRGQNTAEINGTGLGLKIVHDCVDLHNGTVTFVSKEAVGTTFVVTLPIDPMQACPE